MAGSELAVHAVECWIGLVTVVPFVDCCPERCAGLEHDAERSESGCVAVFWVGEVANRLKERWRKD